jgi:hypothetical protein
MVIILNTMLYVHLDWGSRVERCVQTSLLLHLEKIEETGRRDEDFVAKPGVGGRTNGRWG